MKYIFILERLTQWLYQSRGGGLHDRPPNANVFAALIKQMFLEHGSYGDWDIGTVHYKAPTREPSELTRMVVRYDLMYQRLDDAPEAPMAGAISFNVSVLPKGCENYYICRFYVDSTPPIPFTLDESFLRFHPSYDGVPDMADLDINPSFLNAVSISVQNVIQDLRKYGYFRRK